MLISQVLILEELGLEPGLSLPSLMFGSLSPNFIRCVTWAVNWGLICCLAPVDPLLSSCACVQTFFTLLQPRWVLFLSFLADLWSITARVIGPQFFPLYKPLMVNLDNQRLNEILLFFSNVNSSIYPFSKTFLSWQWGFNGKWKWIWSLFS